MANEWVSINNLTREFVWEAITRKALSGDVTTEKRLARDPYRKGQLALFSPLIEVFYADKNGPWTQETKVFGRFPGQEYRPLTRNLTIENTNFPIDYDFDKRDRLALVCEEHQKDTFQVRNNFNIEYFLVPLREGEYIKEDMPGVYSSFQGLQLFQEIIHAGKVDISSIPIEVIKRPGEINLSELGIEVYSPRLPGRTSI